VGSLLTTSVAFNVGSTLQFVVVASPVGFFTTLVAFNIGSTPIVAFNVGSTSSFVAVASPV
ncbi:hypothetical protein KSS87_018849, partial [Heliosperma pusillum]